MLAFEYHNAAMTLCSTRHIVSSEAYTYYIAFSRDLDPVIFFRYTSAAESLEKILFKMITYSIMLDTIHGITVATGGMNGANISDYLNNCARNKGLTSLIACDEEFFTTKALDLIHPKAKLAWIQYQLKTDEKKYP